MNTKDTPMDHDESECEFFLAEGATVFACECGNIEMGDTVFYPKERFDSLKLELQKQKERNRELHNYIEMVVKGTIHQHSPHTQDLLRYLKEAFKKSNEI